LHHKIAHKTPDSLTTVVFQRLLMKLQD